MSSNLRIWQALLAFMKDVSDTSFATNRMFLRDVVRVKVSRGSQQALVKDYFMAWRREPLSQGTVALRADLSK